MSDFSQQTRPTRRPRLPHAVLGSSMKPVRYNAIHSGAQAENRVQGFTPCPPTASTTSNTRRLPSTPRRPRGAIIGQSPSDCKTSTGFRSPPYLREVPSEYVAGNATLSETGRLIRRHRNAAAHVLPDDSFLVAFYENALGIRRSTLSREDMVCTSLFENPELVRNIDPAQALHQRPEA